MESTISSSDLRHRGPAPMVLPYDCPIETDSAMEESPSSQLHLMSLPTEIHIAISRNLTYPDALSLKQTNVHFRSLVRTDVTLKIEWLLERRRLHLECPNSHKCDLGSDLRFCRGSVPLLMRRRRLHFECESRPGLGCLVYGTDKCIHKPKMLGGWGHWLRKSFTVELWWIVVALVPLLCFGFWRLCIQ